MEQSDTRQTWRCDEQTGSKGHCGTEGTLNNKARWRSLGTKRRENQEKRVERREKRKGHVKEHKDAAKECGSTYSPGGVGAEAISRGN